MPMLYPLGRGPAGKVPPCPLARITFDATCVMVLEYARWESGHLGIGRVFRILLYFGFDNCY